MNRGTHQGRRDKPARTWFLWAALCVFFPCFGFGETPDAVKQFIAGNIADKTSVLLLIDPAGDTREQIQRLPWDAIDFVLANHDALGDSPELEGLVLAAVVKANAATSADITRLTRLFALYDTGLAGDSILYCLLGFAKTQPQAVKPAVPGLNAFLQKNADTDYENSGAIIRAIEALSLCGDSSSFAPLFFYARQTRNPAIAAAARAALTEISDGFEQNALGIINTGQFADKLYMFRLIQNNAKFSIEFKSKCAQDALSQAITNGRNSGGAVSSEIVALQTEALGVLVRNKWTQAGSLALSLFPLARDEYTMGFLTEGRFIEVIKAYSALGVTGAGQMLTNYLAVLNTTTENGPTSGRNPVSEAVVLAVINTLGELGDKTAFDNLLYVTYLDYNSVIIESAREALTKLKW